MRSNADIDADFRKLHESLHWIEKAGHPFADIRRFKKVARRLSFDFRCEAEIKELGKQLCIVRQYLDAKRLGVPAGTMLTNCNGNPATCLRKKAHTTPFCRPCQGL